MASVSKELVGFIVVGASAAATHLAVVAGAVEMGHWTPLQANVLGWAVAWCVSFTGHHRWTFATRRAPLRGAAWRFALLSAAGFAINQGAYAFLLHRSGTHYVTLLGAVLVGVAVLTFVLSRLWAFRHRPADAPRAG